MSLQRRYKLLPPAPHDLVHELEMAASLLRFARLGIVGRIDTRPRRPCCKYRVEIITRRERRGYECVVMRAHTITGLARIVDECLRKLSERKGAAA